MKNLLNYLVTNIVDNPDAVSIDEEATGDGLVQLTIHSDQGDIGKIIGKNGKTIHAIRDVVKILATKNDEYVEVQIAEDDKN